MKKNILALIAVLFLLNFCPSFAKAQEKIYKPANLDSHASYPGGIQKFYEWIGKNLKYPAMADRKNVSGIVNVSFVIEKDGTLSTIKTQGPKIGYGLEEEAVRTLKMSGKWNPGKIKNKSVRSKYLLPIKFSPKKK